MNIDNKQETLYVKTTLLGFEKECEECQNLECITCRKKIIEAANFALKKVKKEIKEKIKQKLHIEGLIIFLQAKNQSNPKEQL